MNSVCGPLLKDCVGYLDILKRTMLTYIRNRDRLQVYRTGLCLRG